MLLRLNSFSIPIVSSSFYYLEWAVLENADFRADDLVAFVRNVVLRKVGLSEAMQRLGGRFPSFRR
jgi:hypothetical protein